MKTGRLITGILVIVIMTGFGKKADAQFEREIYTKPYNKIELGGFMQAHLIPADTHKVVIQAFEELPDDYEIEVVNNSLKLNFDKKFREDNVIRVYLNFNELKEIEAGGMVGLKTKNVPIKTPHLTLELEGASVSNLELDVEELQSECSGAAKVNLSGRADSHELEASGAANVKAYNLETRKTQAEVSGAAMAYVNASQILKGKTEGVAKLHYKNKPGKVEINKSESFEKMIDKKVSRKYEDSVKVKVGKFDVQVIDSDTTIIKMGRSQISIDDEGNVEIGKEKMDRKFDGHWSGFYLGVNGYMTEDNSLTIPDAYEKLDLTYEKSINVQLNIFEQNFNLIRERFGLVTGLGFEWNNYRFDNDVVLDGGASDFAFKPEDPNKNYEKSKLVVSYLTLPLLFEFQTNSDNDISSFHIAAGAAGGLRIGSHSKNIIDGDKNKQRTDFHMNPFKLEGMVRIGWGKLNLYTAYDAVPLFKDDKGPELYPFNAGVQILGL